MKLVLEDVKKNTVVNSVKGSREIYDEDDNTKPTINSNQDVIDEFRRKVSQLWWCL